MGAFVLSACGVVAVLMLIGAIGYVRQNKKGCGSCKGCPMAEKCNVSKKNRI